LGLLLSYLIFSGQRAEADRHRSLEEQSRFQRVIELATTKDQNAAARVAGVRSLDEYWGTQYETTAATTLAAVLISDDEVVVREAAADVIGDAIREANIIPEAKRVASLAKLLYGDARD